MKKAKILNNLIVKQFKNAHNFSVTADMPYTTIRSVLERGVDRSSVVTVLKILSFLDITLDELDALAQMNQKGEYDIKDLKSYSPKTTKLPVVGVIRAGEPILTSENIEGFFAVDNSGLCSDKTYFILRVTGDSMDKEFQENDMLLIEKTPHIESGDIGVIRVNEHEATVKRIFIEDNIVQLVPSSNSPVYTPRIIDTSKAELQIIGKVIMAMKKY